MRQKSQRPHDQQWFIIRADDGDINITPSVLSIPVTITGVIMCASFLYQPSNLPSEKRKVFHAPKFNSQLSMIILITAIALQYAAVKYLYWTRATITI